MTDEIRELLELAAKAAGIPLKPDFKERFEYYMQDRLMWNPLTSGEDLVDLMERLSIDALWYDEHHYVSCYGQDGQGFRENYSDHPIRKAALAMAVLRCAAEHGRRVKG